MTRLKVRRTVRQADVDLTNLSWVLLGLCADKLNIGILAFWDCFFEYSNREPFEVVFSIDLDIAQFASQMHGWELPPEYPGHAWLFSIFYDFCNEHAAHSFFQNFNCGKEIKDVVWIVPFPFTSFFIRRKAWALYLCAHFFFIPLSCSPHEMNF